MELKSGWNSQSSMQFILPKDRTLSDFIGNDLMKIYERWKLEDLQQNYVAS